MSGPNTYFRFPSKTIFFAWLVAGTLDLLGAIFVYSAVLQKTTAEKIVRGIASGVFKKQASTGGTEMILYGIGFHYLIALAFTILFFLIFPYMGSLRKQVILTAMLYGAFIWAIMNLLVLPFIFPGPPYPDLSSALIGASVLVIMIGLPLSYFANKYYANKITEA